MVPYFGGGRTLNGPWDGPYADLVFDARVAGTCPVL
jgi:hypothetical protein